MIDHSPNKLSFWKAICLAATVSVLLSRPASSCAADGRDSLRSLVLTARTKGGNEASDAEAKIIGLAKRGDADASFYAGQCFEFGWGVLSDECKARQWYEAGARAGNIDAMLAVARVTARGKTALRDRSRVMELLRVAAEKNNGTAQFILGWCYDKGLERPDLPTEAIELRLQVLSRLLAEPDPDHLGFVARDSGVNSIPQGPTDEVLKWYRLAAQSGNPLALLEMAVGDSENENAASQNGRTYVDALLKTRQPFSVLALSLGGDDVLVAARWPKKTEAIKEAAKAAIPTIEKLSAEGDPYAQEVAAMAKAGSFWCPKDSANAIAGAYRTAYETQKRLADAGDPTWQVKLAEESIYGNEQMPKNQEQAFSWYSQAAGKGDPRAILGLANCYRDGIGVRANAELAKFWQEKYDRMNPPQRSTEKGDKVRPHKPEESRE
jgi:TPR repeat protein